MWLLIPINDHGKLLGILFVYGNWKSNTWFHIEFYILWLQYRHGLFEKNDMVEFEFQLEVPIL